MVEGLEECQECTRLHAQLLDSRPHNCLTWTTAIPELQHEIHPEIGAAAAAVPSNGPPLRVRERNSSQKQAVNWNPLVFTQSSMVGGARHFLCKLKQAFQRFLRESSGTPGSGEPPPPPPPQPRPSQTLPSFTDSASKQERSAWLCASNNRPSNSKGAEGRR